MSVQQMRHHRKKDRAPPLRPVHGLGRWRIKTVDVYVARIFLAAYAACAASFIGLFVVIEAFAKLNRFLEQESSLVETLFRYNVAMVPTVFTNYMGPILTTSAAMFTVTLLNRHNELSPIKAAGVSMYRLLAPMFFFGVLLTAFTFYLQEEVLPRFREPIRTALEISHARPLNPEPYYDADNGLWITVREYSTTLQIGRDVSISRTHPNGLAKLQIDSKQIEWVPSPTEAAGTEPNQEMGSWILHDGSVQRWDEAGNLIVDAAAASFERLKTVFSRKELTTTMRPIDLETSDIDISYLSWHELKTQYQRQPYHRHLAVKLHHHFAFPLSHLVLLLVGLPLVIKAQNRSLFVGLAGSFAIGAVFYLVSSICMSVASDSLYFSPVLAAWLPIMLFGSLGVTLFDQIPT